MNETTTDHERDVEAIKRIIADVETRLNTKDPTSRSSTSCETPWS